MRRCAGADGYQARIGHLSATPSSTAPRSWPRRLQLPVRIAIGADTLAGLCPLTSSSTCWRSGSIRRRPPAVDGDQLHFTDRDEKLALTAAALDAGRIALGDWSDKAMASVVPRATTTR